MSGSGAPDVQVDGSGLRVAVVSASWHDKVMDGLRAGADRALAQAGVEQVDRVRVPGSFELPVACARLAGSRRYDALVALGVVIRGGTPHFDYVCQAATQGLTSVSVCTGIPNGSGCWPATTSRRRWTGRARPDPTRTRVTRRCRGAGHGRRATRSLIRQRYDAYLVLEGKERLECVALHGCRERDDLLRWSLVPCLEGLAGVLADHDLVLDAQPDHGVGPVLRRSPSPRAPAVVSTWKSDSPPREATSQVRPASLERMSPIGSGSSLSAP